MGVIIYCKVLEGLSLTKTSHNKKTFLPRRSTEWMIKKSLSVFVLLNCFSTKINKAGSEKAAKLRSIFLIDFHSKFAIWTYLDPQKLCKFSMCAHWEGNWWLVHKLLFLLPFESPPKKKMFFCVYFHVYSIECLRNGKKYFGNNFGCHQTTI